MATIDERETPLIDLEALYEQSFPAVHAFACRMLGDREAALDVAQESFARAWAALGTFRGDSAPITWVLSITRNLCLARLQRNRERTYEDFEAVVTSSSRPPSTQHTDIERALYLAEVKEGCLTGLIGCLPVSQRTVFVLHLLNDLPIADVSRIMGKSPNAVRILLSRARASMRAFLCSNCEWLGGTTCRCENLIEFSLRRDLIEPFAVERADSIGAVRDELVRFEDEVDLFRSLPGERAAAGLARAMADGRYAIFGTK